MKAPSFAAGRAAAAPRALDTERLARAVAHWAPLAAIGALAVFLRVYGLHDLITFYPDTYGQLRAADNLLSGDFPITYLYPPGIAVFLAPVFAVLPRTLAVLQGTIVVAGLALVLLAYVASLRATDDRRVALIHAAFVACASTFVFHTRVALFDVITTLLVVSALLLAPWVTKRGPVVWVAYGVLVFAAITTRYTSPAILPALFLASYGAGARPLTLRGVVAHLRSGPIVTAALVVVVLSATYLATMPESLTRFGNSQSGSIIDFGGYVPRLGQYVEASLIGYGEVFLWPYVLVAAAVAPFAVIGARQLWRTNRAFAAPVFCLLLTWAPMHAVYRGFWGRYAMPMFFFVLMFVALGIVLTLTRFRTLRYAWQRVGVAGLLTIALTLFATLQIGQDIIILARPDSAARDSEGAYEEIRTVLRELDGPGSVLVSSQIFAVDRANPDIADFDLLHHSETYGINDDSIARLVTFVREEQAQGRSVYYHYTGYEAKNSRLMKYERTFSDYFRAIKQIFPLREVARASERPQRLYLIEPVPPAGG